jgi:hypothetical protein
MGESQRAVAGKAATEVSAGQPMKGSKRAASDPGYQGSRRLSRAEKRRRRLRKKYNRSYMRQWRANSQSKPKKRRRRRRTNPRGAQGRFQTKSKSRPKRHGLPLCGICGRVQATCAVTRLQITQDTPSGFRVVHVPYCGVC